MARVNVYVPDDLLARAKNADLPISELAQRALADALVHQERMGALQQFVDGLVASRRS
jgi:post-segregation antitoxin (ccd killing protein)